MNKTSVLFTQVSALASCTVIFSPQSSLQQQFISNIYSQIMDIHSGCDRLSQASFNAKLQTGSQRIQYDMHFVLFSMRWIFLTTGDSDLETSGEKIISHGKPYKMHFLAYFTLQGTLIMVNILRKVADHENHVGLIYLTTVLNMGESQKYARKVHLYTLMSSHIVRETFVVSCTCTSFCILEKVTIF